VVVVALEKFVDDVYLRVEDEPGIGLEAIAAADLVAQVAAQGAVAVVLADVVPNARVEGADAAVALDVG